MPRLIVATEDPHIRDGTGITLDEDVRSVHLSSEHAASQLVERIAWAVGDAEARYRATRGGLT
ncbi:MAG TPA: hypothetical protein VNV44_12820 [Solirubrobacteraceae bacterium]|jgi:hypothetical protein|nr:hypothetical protein [Solirubrobacteraceae bacterium]